MEKKKREKKGRQGKAKKQAAVGNRKKPIRKRSSARIH
jgi:hypothetical protein